ncbi:sugar transferase [Youngiibacter fragilis]|uniref:Bacterial sugar transferase domain-containing protein n=1 Tax=Youngiibacter fragilis 232.1 TaxID=994573 RepID=V7I240_9CLOT|nr:sugar transferase [Youngiibacter fragilis]ETA80305.1 hypothetical protein T472_0212145 [Youngiibacter fragilis 232.1]
MGKRVRTDLGDLMVLAVDIMLMIIAYDISYFLVYGTSTNSLVWAPFVESVPVMVLLYIFLMTSYGLWKTIRLDLGEVIYSVFLTTGTLSALVFLISRFMVDLAYPKYIFASGFVISFILISIWRTAAYWLLISEHGRKDLLVIGGRDAGRIAVKAIEGMSRLYNVRAVSDWRSGDLGKYIEENEVIFLSDEIEGKEKSSLIDMLMSMKKSVYVVPGNYEINILRAHFERASDKPLIKLRMLELTIEQRILKRMLDLVFSVTGLILLSPVVAVAAWKIKAYDGGPVFYTQERLTRGNRIFRICKLRSMVMDAEKETGPSLAEYEDGRITPVGRRLRASRLDEIPQLLNVLKGEMSIVGPRPERQSFFEEYSGKIPDYKYRTVVKAGLTGYAQVYGSYASSPEDKARYDLLYIKEYSLLRDIKIILLTMKIMFMKEKAGGVRKEPDIYEIAREKGLDITIDI